MKSLSYNLSANLKTNIDSIENLKRKLLLTPISPINESRLQWEANIDRIYWYFHLRETPINKDEIIRLFSKKTSEASSIAKLVFNYKKVFDYLYLNWLVTDIRVTPKIAKALDKAISQGNASNINSKAEKIISPIFDYLQTGKEHPIIQSGIANIIFSTLPNLSQTGNITGNLIGYLFLYKYGYDFRRLLVMEEYLYNDRNIIQRIKQAAQNSQNMTLWLEFYSEGIQIQLAKTLQKVSSDSFSSSKSFKNLWKLNRRQKEILAYMQEPEKKITNKDVQNMFKVSQITASRDLSKLATSGLIFSRGKGRSVFYIKV